MQLTELFPTQGPDAVRFLHANAATEINGMALDSRRIGPGNLFIALRGKHANGADYIPQALQAGAAAILVEDEADAKDIPPEIQVIVCPQARRMTATAAARFFRQQPAHLVAVTGTDGKTSVAHFTRQIWHHMGLPCASIGTLGVIAGKQPLENMPHDNTTPDAIALHRTLSQLKGEGVDHCIIEASSIGIDQHRMDGTRIKVAAFTNFSRDHLDYHPDLQTYLKCKVRLFSELVEDGGTAVLNTDDAKYPDFLSAARQRKLPLFRYGLEGNEIRVHFKKPTERGIEVEATILGSTETLNIPLWGEFQANNVLCAMAIVLAAHGNKEQVLSAIPKLNGVPGRLELAAEHPAGARIFVDYAHTPSALEHMLRSLRPHCGGKLVVVFGCGGDRDHGKRQEMGSIAAKLADTVIVTDDNPRTEDPHEIRTEIMTGCPQAKNIGDRQEAITHAIRALGENDVMVIAGKGHEKFQVIGDHAIPFDDVAVAQAAVRKVRGAA